MHDRILLIGQSGFLGSALLRALECTGIGRETFDLAKVKEDSLRQVLRQRRFAAALICAAVGDVEKCVREPEQSHQVNVLGMKHLLQILGEHAVKPVFFSSDYVFLPQAKRLVETDQRLPQTCYGKQKLEIENYLEANFPEHLIFRTSKLMSQSAHPRNILQPVLTNLTAGAEIRAFVDQWINPVFVEDVAAAVSAACAQKLVGAFHLGTRQVYTRFELAKVLADRIGADPALVLPLSMKEVAFSEPRPSHNTLDCSKFESATNFHFTELADVDFSWHSSQGRCS